MRFLKSLVGAFFQAMTLPWAVAYWASAPLPIQRRLAWFQAMSQWWSLWPGRTGQYLRKGFYRWTITSCSRDCCIEFGTVFSSANITIPHGVYIGVSCNVGDVVFGTDVLVGSGVSLLSGRHQHYFSRLDVPIRLQGGRNDTIRIGADCWIGNGALVMANIGDQAIVAAGSVVLQPVAPRSIVGGNPARVIGTRGELESS